MKIEDIRVAPVAVPYKKSGKEPLTSVIVEVTTDTGITGIGESPAVLGGKVTADIIESTREILIGRDASAINPLMKLLYVAYHANQLHVQSVSWIFSGIELALWDIGAKTAGVPLHEYWGGTFRKKIELMGVIERDKPERMTAAAADLMAQGYRTVYTELGRNPQEDVEAVKAIRRGMPDKSKLICADMGQMLSTGMAVTVINGIQDQGIGWIEQPTMRYNLQSLHDVKGRVNVPIMSHESGSTMYDVLNVIKANGADYLKLDARYDAGYNGVRISAGIAESAGIQCVYDGTGQLGVAMAGALHVMAAYPNFSMAYSWGDYPDLENDILVGGKFRMEELPYVNVPDDPGLGIKLDQDLVKQYHDYYIREIYEKGTEHKNTDPYQSGGMFRQYFKDFEE